MRYRLRSPDEWLPRDESGLRAALDRYGAEIECVPDSDMIIGFRDRERALAAAECVRRCRALANGAELEVLTHWQLKLLDDIDERRVAELERIPQTFIAKRDAKNRERKADAARRKALALAEAKRLQKNTLYLNPRKLYGALASALFKRYPETFKRRPHRSSLLRYLKDSP